jgi:hypothetical protein
MSSAALQNSRSNSRTASLWIGALVLLAALSLFAMWRSMGRAMQMKAETTSSSSFAQLKEGDEVKLVLEITAVNASASLEGNRLEKQTETVYRRTGQTARIAFDAATPIVMGKPPDVHAGAVVHVTAKMGSDQALHATQIVVLTGYVQVQDKDKDKAQ